EHSPDFQKYALDVHELAERLEGEHKSKRAVFEWQIYRVARQPDRRAGKSPAVHQGDPVAQRVGGDVQREAIGAEFVREHVTGVPRVSADFKERRHRSDELQMIANDGAAPDILLSVRFDSPLGLAERSEIMEFNFRAFNRECL